MAGLNSSGYECEFVDPVKDFECPLCLHVTRDPNLTSCCGQYFCRVCISRILASRKHRCPLCKAGSFNVLLDKQQNQRVLKLKVYCVMKKEGCEWAGELGDLDAHLDASNGDCQHITVNCANNCGERLQKYQLVQHLSGCCVKRDFICKYCGLHSTYADITSKHWSECVKYPIPCPNKCDTGTIEQGFLEEHLSECPLQLLKCEFHLAGCKEKIQRKDLEDHVEKNVGKHLNLLSVFTKDLLAEKQRETQKLAEKEKKISQLHRVMTQMQNELREKDKQIKLLQTRARSLETASLLPPVEFTLHNYSQYEGMGTRWSDGPTFYTHPMGYKVKIRVYFTQFFRRADLELQSMEGEFDDELKWPLKGTLTIQLLNQLGEGHLERSVDLQVKRNSYSDELSIKYRQIKNTQNGIQYLKDDCLQFRVDMKLK